MPTALGDGQPLPADLRRGMEGRFGAELGAVRVHDDDAGADLAQRAGAEAITAGTDVAFAPGRFDPTSRRGRHRLAHELTHVVQQARTPGALATMGLRQPKPGRGAAPAVQPTTLDTLPESERKNIQAVTTTSVTVPGIDGKFSTKGATTTSPFPGNTTMVWDPSVPAALQHGLKNVAGSLTAGVELTPAPLVGNSTITLGLDLTAHGGSRGLYRFTLVTTAAAKGKGAPAGRILVESLGAAIPPLGTTAPAAAGAAPVKDPVADKIKDNGIRVSYGGAELDAVRAAIAQVPASHLAVLKGLRFARDTKHPTDPKAAGRYDPKAHTITMFDSAFSGTQVAFKSDGATASSYATRSIVHEIGHAVDLAPLRDAAKVKETADAAVTKLPQDYPDPDDPKGYRWDSKESKADIDRRLATQSKSEKKQLSVRSRSGSQTIKKGADLEDVVGTEVVKGGFREAAKKDGPRAVSEYGDGDWQENYAEAYSLYLTSPSTLRSLRPNVFAYLDRTLPR